MIKAALALAALLLPVVAHAEDWRVVTISEDGAAIFMLDADSMTPGEGRVRRARILAVTGQDRAGFAALSATMDFDCEDLRKRIVTVTAYSAAGNALSTEGLQPWGDMAPNSNYANVSEIVCGTHEMPDYSLGAGLPIAAARALLEEDRARPHQTN